MQKCIHLDVFFLGACRWTKNKLYYVFVRRGQHCFQITFIAICISKQVCGNVGTFVYSVHKGVFTASSHSLSLLDFREILLKSADSPCRVRSQRTPVLTVLAMERLAPVLDKLRVSLHTRLLDLQDVLCGVTEARYSLRVLLPGSMHECAPVKIDLLKGQQPLNPLPQEACFPLQDDTRNMGCTSTLTHIHTFVSKRMEIYLQVHIWSY